MLAFLYNACNDCNLNGMSEQRQDVNQAFREELLGWHFAVEEWCCRGKKNLKGKIELSKHDFPLSATGSIPLMLPEKCNSQTSSPPIFSEQQLFFFFSSYFEITL